MRYMILFLCVFAFADVSGIISKIKYIETHKINCSKPKGYNIFISKPLEKKSAQQNVKRITLSLNAVFQNMANINGVWVKKGDVIDGFYVLKINDKSVVLKKDGRIIILTNNKNVLKVSK